MSLNSLICHVSVFISLLCSNGMSNSIPGHLLSGRGFAAVSGSIEDTLPQNSFEAVVLTLKIEDNKVKIAWKVTDKSTYSHFEILKSNDNKTFDPVALFFTDESLALKDFTYSEKYSENRDVLSAYYKIKCFSMDGKIIYTKAKNITLKPRQ